MTAAKTTAGQNGMRLLMWLCVAALVFSTLPLYAISFHNHPYYDDFGLSADVHHTWIETGSLQSVLQTAVESAKTVRQTWQGTYTGTFLSNIQPGIFSENLYFISTFLLLSAFLLCFGYFLYTALHGVMGVPKQETVAASCLLLMLMVQLMPDVGEAFFWFNGGIGNVFIYSLLALSFALMWRLLNAKGAIKTTLLMVALAVLMVLLGGGSYGGGVFALCTYGLALLWLFVKKHPRKWLVLALYALFGACFLYSVAAPGNAVRAGVVGIKPSVIKTIVLALYYGVAQMGSYLRLPLLAVSALCAPWLYRAAKQSMHSFSHPWVTLIVLACLYCTQLAAPLYGIGGIGGGRIEDTYFISFVVLWMGYLYYLLGFAARRAQPLPQVSTGVKRGLAIACVCALLVGLQGFKRSSDTLYGVQNLSGVSAALSIVSGEAAQYDREMDAREALLNDQSQKSITLSPLSVTPAVLMDDLIDPNAAYDVRPSLMLYYQKDAIAIEGEGDLP